MKAIFLTFDLMKNLFVTSMIVRSKVFMHWWLIIKTKISHRCNLINLNTFDLMIVLSIS
jgi:hypothetical protein